MCPFELLSSGHMMLYTDVYHHSGSHIRLPPRRFVVETPNPKWESLLMPAVYGAES